MLTSLQIKNFLTIQTLELEFKSGLTVITGETGAGKSIIVEAISLILGERANSTLIRKNAEKCEIAARFDLSFSPLAHEWLKTNEFMEPEEATVLVRRVLTQSGHSKIYINQSLATATHLQQLGNLLVHTHTQQSHQTLLSATTQRNTLDSFGQHLSLVDDVKTSYLAWQASEEALKAKETRANQNREAQERLSHEVKELDQLALQENELPTLEQKYRRLTHLEKLISHIQSSLALLEEKEENSVQAGLLQTHRLLQEISDCDSQLQIPIQHLEEAHILIQEAVQVLKSCLKGTDSEPDELSNIATRLESIHSLARKHHVPASELSPFHQKCKSELSELETLEPKITALQQEMTLKKQIYFNKARQLTEARQTTALRFEKALLPYLKQLGMPYGKFKIQFLPVDTGEASLHGLEKIEWQITTNPDHPLSSLKQVVSGGELSRISLAIHATTAMLLPTPTFLFDEVDVGVGGKTADIVGQLLKKLGEHKQVMCITHLAQVAVWGASHIRVEKTVRDHITYSTIESLTEEQRITEIARMVGGKNQTPETLKHAGKMLVLAKGL